MPVDFGGVKMSASISGKAAAARKFGKYFFP